MDFKDLEIGDTYYYPHSGSTAGYKKTGEKTRLQVGTGKTDAAHPSAGVIKVELDEKGNAIMPPPYPHVPIELWGKNHPDHILPANWSYYGTRISWQDSKLSIKYTGQRPGTKTYRVTLDEGHWPENTDLITLCDGSVPPHACHFGGTVTAGEKERTVQLYFD